MATIRKRRNRYCVIYRCEDENGKEHQKWETFATNEEAKRRKKEIEAQEFVGTIVVPSAKTLNELMEEYMASTVSIPGQCQPMRANEVCT